MVEFGDIVEVDIAPVSKKVAVKLPLRTARPQPRLGVFNEGPMLQVSVAGS